MEKKAFSVMSMTHDYLVNFSKYCDAVQRKEKAEIFLSWSSSFKEEDRVNKRHVKLETSLKHQDIWEIYRKDFRSKWECRHDWMGWGGGMNSSFQSPWTTIIIIYGGDKSIVSVGQENQLTLASHVQINCFVPQDLLVWALLCFCAVLETCLAYCIDGF